MSRLLPYVVAAIVCASLGGIVIPQGWAAIHAFRSDEASTRYQVSRASVRDYVREVDLALASADVDLAQSLVAVAADHNVVLPQAVLSRVEEASQKRTSSVQDAWRGAVTGEGQTTTGKVAAFFSDLSPMGDVRDLIEQAELYPAYDPLTASLAALGLASTAMVIPTGGAAMPVKLGASIIKKAKKAGQLSTGLVSELVASARRSIDGSALAAAANSAKRFKFGEAAAKARQVFNTGVVNDIERVASALDDVARGPGAGAAFHAITMAKSVEDVTRLGKVARMVEPRHYRGVIQLAKGAGRAIWDAVEALTAALLWIGASFIWLVSSLLVAAKVLRMVARFVRSQAAVT